MASGIPERVFRPRRLVLRLGDFIWNGRRRLPVIGFGVMTSPMKPWEGAINMNEPSVSNILNSNGGAGCGVVPPGISAQPPRSRIVVPHGTVVQQLSQQAPPLPSRRALGGGPHRRQPGGYHSVMFGGYHGSAGYGGPMGPYGDYGYPTRRMPITDDFESRFIQLAEDSSGPAFQSIETFVRSFSSFTMMLESTYQAVYMSFRAVLSVADNMAKLRRVIGQFVTSLAVLKTIRWFYFRIRQILGLVSNRRLSEEVWSCAVDEATGKVGSTQSRSVWPLVAFFSFVFAGPYLVLKLIKLPPPEKDWCPTEPGESVQCLALFDFDSAQPNELSFQKGDRLLIAREAAARKAHGGWILAAHQGESTVGYIPANRVAIVRAGGKPKQAKPQVDDGKGTVAPKDPPKSGATSDSDVFYSDN
ncbi:hypothetical protein AAG570_007253 [Ranatra chinensis]|uniref:Peroxisomal membrane protein PEX13 n=1 Tax=Ranatra chinensis TaxID=642074 RepID=A0ABD0XVB8_9HEMI